MITKFKLFENQIIFKKFDFIIQPYTENIYILLENINEYDKLYKVVEIGKELVDINRKPYFSFNHDPRTVRIQKASKPYLYEFKSKYLNKFIDSKVFDFLEEHYDFNVESMKKKQRIKQFKI